DDASRVPGRNESSRGRVESPKLYVHVPKRLTMRSPLTLAAVVALALTSTAPVAGYAQGAPQTVQLAKVDVIKTATGYRASKIIGAIVVNDANESIGKVDDIIVGTDKLPYLVLSVGGFLGVG